MKYELKDNRFLQVTQDPDPESPRDWDNIGTMVCFHSRYSLGDDVDLDTNDFTSWDDLRKHLEEKLEATIILPLYLFDHSGISISTTPFSCKWDSGQVGFIYISKEKMLKEYGNLDQQTIDIVTKYLEHEVEIYDQYLRGEVYEFVITEVNKCSLGHEHYEEIDSCGGFFGSDIQKNGILSYLDKDDTEELLKQLNTK